MHIPLVRPEIPLPEDWLTYYAMSKSEGQFSNHGPCERLATEQLDKLTSKHTVLCSSGTAALQAIIVACVPRYSYVGVPDFTFAATERAVRMAGCQPVILPCDRNGLPLIKDESSRRYSHFVVTAPFGCDPMFEVYDRIARIDEKSVIYDCAGGHGLQFDRTINPVAISFHATKNLPIGEGGAALFSAVSPVLRARSAINFVGDYGFNGKMSELHAAVLCAQLEPRNLLRAEQRGAHRKAIIAAYAAQCDRLIPRFSRGAPSLCAFVDALGDPDSIVGACAKAGIAAKRGYWPLMANLPDTDNDLRNVVCLPSSVTFAEVEEITAVIRGIT